MNRKSQPLPQSLAKLKTEILRTSSKSRTVSKIKAEFNPHFVINHFGEILDRDPGYYRLLYGNPLPETLAGLCTPLLTIPTGRVEKELAWNEISFQKFADKINTFVSYRQIFEASLLSGRYEAALNALDSLDASVCASLWSLENRFIVHEHMGGYQSNRALLNDILSSHKEALVSAYADWFSRKADKRLTTARYLTSFNRAYADIFRDSPEAQAYISYKLSFLGTFDFSNIDSILFCENQSSVIDRYVTHVRACQLICADSSFKKVRHHAIASAKHMAEYIDDCSLTRLIQLSRPGVVNRPTTVDETLIKAIDLYTRNECDDAANVSFSLIQEHPTLLDAYFIYIKSVISSGKSVDLAIDKDTISAALLTHLYSLFTRSSDSETAFSELFKLVKSFGNTNWAQQLNWLISTYFQGNPTLDFEKLSVLNSPCLNPLFYTVYETPNEAIEFLNNVLVHIPESTGAKLFLETKRQECLSKPSAVDLPIPNQRKIRYQAAVSMRCGKKDDAVALLSGLLDHTEKLPPYILHDIRVSLVSCLLKLGRGFEAAEIAVTDQLENPSRITRMPWGDLVDLNDDTPESSYYEQLTLPILLSIYKDHLSKESDEYELYLSKVYAAYDNFLFVNGFERPSEIIQEADRFPENHVIYFLEHICVPEILDSSDFANTIDDVFNERAKICELLKEINPKDLEKYNNEIVRITQDALIKKAIQQVNESKIYVDMKGLKAYLERTLDEGFRKYVEVASVPSGGWYPLGTVEPLAGVQGRTNKEPLIYTANALIPMFREMFLEVKDAFLFNRDFGLNTHLSSRIRHGTLSGHFRSQFEAVGLLTQRDNISGNYEKNVYWSERLSYLDSNALDYLNRVLASFSEKIDGIAGRIVNCWIQIKDADRHPDGRFDFNYNTAEILVTYARTFLNKYNLNDFIELALEELWKKTQGNLIGIRNEFNGPLNEEIHLALNQLELDLTRHISRDEGAPLYNAISKCKTNVQEEIKSISEWFNIVEKVDAIDFTLSLAIEASMARIRSINPNLVIDSQININSDKNISGKFLVYFIDILLILLDNASKHSGIPPHQKLNINIEASFRESTVIINIENGLAATVDRNRIHSHLDDLYLKLGAQEPGDNVSTEGGTGYLKISNILSRNLGANPIKIEPVLLDEKFRTTLEFSAEALIATIKDSNN